MKEGYRFCRTVMFILGVAMCSCRAPAAPDSGFLDSSVSLRESAESPFDAVWNETGFDPTTYDTILLAPIDTTHLLKMSWWDELSLSGSSKQEKVEAVKLAIYFRQQLIAKLGASSGKPRYAERAEGKSLQLELALVEVVPTKVWLNTIGYALAGAFDHGSTAMEGRFRDLATGKIVSRWKDREYGQTSLISVADLTWYSHAYHTLDYWSGLLAEVAHATPSETIPSRDTVTLRAW